MQLTRQYRQSRYANKWLKVDQREVYTSTVEILVDDDELTELLLGRNSYRNRVKRRAGTATFITPEGERVKISGTFKLLNGAFEYKFEKLYKSKVNVNVLEAAGEIEYRPCKPFTEDVMSCLLKTLTSIELQGFKPIANPEEVCRMAAAATGGIIGFLKHHGLANLLKEPYIMRYAYFEQLQTVERVYSPKIAERVVFVFTPEQLIKLHTILTTGKDLLDLCFHSLKVKLCSAFKILPDVDYIKLIKLRDCMDGYVPSLWDDVCVGAVSIYSEILKVSMYGLSYAERNNRATIFKPKTSGNSATELRDVFTYARYRETVSSSLNWMKEREIIFQVSTAERQMPLIYTAEAYRVEKDLATLIASVQTAYKQRGGEAALSLRLTPYDKSTATILEDAQLVAYQHALNCGITVITGPGGTGKSKVIEKIVEHYDPEQIVLVAPTNKLASSLRKRIMPAFTLHKAISAWGRYTPTNNGVSVDTNGSKRRKVSVPATTKTASEQLLELIQTVCKKASRTSNMEDRDVPAIKNIKIFIVDDISLVDPSLMKHILELLINYGQLMKLILVGDPQQLPSIRWGRLLESLIEALPDCVIKLEKNHRNNSQTIFDNATKILSGDTNLRTDNSFHIIDTKPEQLEKMIKGLLKGPLKDVPIEKLQFIAFTSWDVKLINTICRKHFLDIPEGVNVKQPTFFIREKIYITKNRPDYDIYNGELWIITEIFDANINAEGNFVDKSNVQHTQAENRGVAGRHRFVRLISESGKDVRVLCTTSIPFTWKNVSTGFAVTIHKYQGLDNEYMIYVAINLTAFDTRKHVCTAVTRSTRVFYMLTNSRFMHGVSKRPYIERLSALPYFMQEAMQVIM